MGLVKSGDNGTQKGRIAPPPPGVSASAPAPAVKKHAVSSGSRIAGQELLNSLLKSPEMAGRFTTHAEFLEAVKKDFDVLSQFLKGKGYWDAD